MLQVSGQKYGHGNFYGKSDLFNHDAEVIVRNYLKSSVSQISMLRKNPLKVSNNQSIK